MASLIHTVAPKLPMLVTLGALGSIAAAAAPVAWHLGGWSAAMPERPVAAAAADLPEPEPVQIDTILDLAPFGVVEAPPEPDVPIGETTLDLLLHGVVVQGDPAASMAFIGQEGASEGYRPDDMIADRARLVEVAADHVVLDVEGELQTLSFPEPGDAAPSAETGGATSGPDRLRELVAAQTQGGGAEAVPQDEGPQTTQDHIQLWRDRIRANPQEVLDAIGLIPTENGYRIAEQHDSGVGLAGLQAGDVVTSVNGQAVGDVEQDRALFDNVAASGLARVEVQRDGRTIVMSFPLQ